MENLYELPAKALAAFEAVTGMGVSIHDRSKSLVLFLPPERFMHQSPLCKAVKAAGHEVACIRFDAQKTHEDLARKPEGRVQICHAGLSECAVPVFYREKLEWVLFAGPRLPGQDLKEAVRDEQRALKAPPYAKWPNLPKPLGATEAANVLEMLRQLAARLLAWRADFEKTAQLNTQEPAAIFPLNPLTRRQAVITKLIHDQHRGRLRLKDVAKALHLSESRAGHAVKEACGATFVELLTQARLRSAAGLLRYTSLPVRDIAARSGFEDVSHFHAVFKSRFKSTPHRYRKTAT